MTQQLEMETIRTVTLQAFPRVWKFGDDIDTDAIIPGRFLTINNPDELAKHAFEGTRNEFARKVQQGDVIVGGRNFGCGSSREHAPLAIKESGIAAVVAKSFARIFYRNAINIGLPIVECDCAIDEGDEIEIDFDNGKLINLTKDTTAEFPPFPEFLQKIIAAGGLLNSLK